MSENQTRDPLRSNDDFIQLWTSGASSGLGTSMAALAYPLLALSVADTAGQAGLLGLVALAASTLIRLPAGTLIDELPLRRVLVGAHLLRVASTAVLLAIVVTGHLMLWQLLTVAGINASSAAFAEIAHSVAVRHVVAPEQQKDRFAMRYCPLNYGRRVRSWYHRPGPGRIAAVVVGLYWAITSPVRLLLDDPDTWEAILDLAGMMLGLALALTARLSIPFDPTPTTGRPSSCGWACR